MTKSQAVSAAADLLRKIQVPYHLETRMGAGGKLVRTVSTSHGF